MLQNKSKLKGKWTNPATSHARIDNFLKLEILRYLPAEIQL